MAAEGGASPPLFAVLAYTKWYVKCEGVVIGELSLNHHKRFSFYDVIDDRYGSGDFLLFRDYDWWVAWLEKHVEPGL